MKTNILTIIAISLALQPTFAKNSVRDLMPTITDQDSPQAVMVKADQAIRQMYSRLKLGQIQIQTQSVIHEIKKEVVTERKTSHSKSGLMGKLSGLFIGGSFNASSEQSDRLDITQVISTNINQVEAQKSKAARELDRLKSQLQNLVSQNQEELVVLKELAIVEAAAIYRLVQDGAEVPWAQVNQTLAMTQDLSFMGAQQVKSCVTMKHAASYNYEQSSESAGLKLRLLFFSVNLGGDRSSRADHRRYAYSEKSCSASTQIVSADGSDSAFGVNLTLLDQDLEQWRQAIETLRIVTTQAPHFPTWGSPYYQQ